MATDISIEIHQMSVRLGPDPRNRASILGALRASTADLCVFPEASTTGFCYRELADATEANRPFLDEVCAVSREVRRGVCLPLLMEGPGGVFNRTYVIHPEEGILGWYDKIHLIGILHEDRYLMAGSRPVVLDYRHEGMSVRIGLATCYDLRFPELFRRLVLDLEAEVLIVPAMWPQERIHHFSILTAARALENLTPLLACNSVGPCGDLLAGGRSAVVSAWGESLFAGSPDAECSFTFQFDRRSLAEARSRLPALRDAREFLLPPILAPAARTE